MTPADPSGPEFQAALERLTNAAWIRRTEAIEARIPALVDRLHAADVRVLVLKGPATRLWLYDPDEPRPTGDIDLLVSPRDHRRARAILRCDGYEKLTGGGHSDTLSNGETAIDLHLAIPFTTAGPATVFEVLHASATTLAVAGADIPVLDLATHALHLAVHAAQNDFDPAHRSLDEWDRALRRLTDRERSAAAAVAARLGAGATWRAAVAALEPDADVEAIVAGLPVRKPQPSARSLVDFARSPLPPIVRWRALRQFAAVQLSDEVTARWRSERGLPPVEPGTMAGRRAKLQRLARRPRPAVARRPRTDLPEGPVHTHE